MSEVKNTASIEQIEQGIKEFKSTNPNREQYKEEIENIFNEIREIQKGNQKGSEAIIDDTEDNLKLTLIIQSSNPGIKNHGSIADHINYELKDKKPHPFFK